MPAFRSLASFAACVFILVAARYSGAQDPANLEVLDRQEADVLVESIREEGLGSGLRESVKVQLRRDGMAEAEIAGAVRSIEKRMTGELVRLVRGMEGRAFGEIEEVEAAVAARRKLIAHNVASWPKGYARGFPTTFVVDKEDAERLLIGVEGLVRACEKSLRETVRELALQGTVAWEEVRVLRDFSRARALSRARRTVSRMRGASFFSEADARLYLENAVASELETLRQRVQDPSTRTIVLENARTRSIMSVN